MSKLLDWLLEYYEEGDDSFHYYSKVIFAAKFLMVTALTCTVMALLSVLIFQPLVYSAVIGAFFFNVFILILFRNPKYYRYALLCHVWYQILCVSFFILAGRSMHIVLVIWYIIPIVFSHLSIGKKAFTWVMVYSFLVMITVSFLSMTDTRLVDFGIESKPSVEWMTPVICFPALVIIYFLFSAYTKSNDLAANYLRNEKEKVEVANDVKKNVIQIVAHDLRGPFSSIVGLTSLVKHSLQKPGELNRDELDLMMDKILETCEHSEGLISRLLDVEKLENEDDTLNKDVFSIVATIDRCIRNTKDLSEKKGVKVVFRSEIKDSSFYGDPVRIEQLLNNLINNALKFSHPNSVVLVTLETKGQFFMISVADQGIGIALEDREKVFDKFSKARRKGTSGEATHGLGLSIVDRIVELHGGFIELDSEVGKGSTFSIFLPLNN